MSKSVLFLAPYREASGYGAASRLYLRALLSVGCDVTARPIEIAGGDVALPDEILACEKTTSNGEFDVVFQIAPPTLFEWVGGTGSRQPMNVGLFFVETNPLPTDWAMTASLMDAVIVPTKTHYSWVKNSPNFTGSLHRIAVPADHAKYEKLPKLPDALHGAEPAFRFYSIGEWNRRKNWEGLLRAYFMAFDPFEPVELVIKTSGVQSEIEGQVLDTASRCGIRTFPKVRVVTDKLDEDEILGLHKSCDVFVQASYNEGWSLPAYDALRMGRTPIVTSAGGFLDYIDESSGWLVQPVDEPCFDGGNIHPELYTGRQVWSGPHLPSLATAMRSAFTYPRELERRRGRRLSNSHLFELGAIGTQLLGVFHGSQEE